MTGSRARRNGVAPYMASMPLVLSMPCRKRRKRRDRAAQPGRLLQAGMLRQGWKPAGLKWPQGAEGPGRDSRAGSVRSMTACPDAHGKKNRASPANTLNAYNNLLGIYITTGITCIIYLKTL